MTSERDRLTPCTSTSGDLEDLGNEFKSDIPIKDLFFMSDIKKYHKYGKFPYILIFHTFLVIFTTSIILLHIDDLSLFRFHMRSLDMTFNHLTEDSPNIDSSSIKYEIGSMKELNDQIDFVLEKVFSLNQQFAHDVKVIDLNKLKMEIHYFHSYISNTSLAEYDIVNKDDNPIKKLGDNDKIRNFLLHVESLIIPIQYEMMEYSRNRMMHLLWETLFIFDFTNRGFILFYTKHKFRYLKNSFFREYVYENLYTEYGLINLLILIMACCEVVIVVKRLYEGLQFLLSIKRKLKKIQFEDDECSVLNTHQRISSPKGINFYRTVTMKTDSSRPMKKTKWDMLQLKDKRKFLNWWYFVIVSANFFQIVCSINHLFYPILNETNQFLLGVSVILTWFSCGFFFEYEEKYNFFYRTMKKSIKTNSKYLVVFSFIFIGYSMMISCNFYYSEKYYSNIHMTFTTVFASLLGDSLIDYWHSTLDINPVKTIVFSVFFFLFFVAFFLRIIIIVTEESFDCIKMQKNYEWLDSKISLGDYIKHEIDLEKMADDNEHKHLMSHFMMNVLIAMEENKAGQLNELQMQQGEIEKLEKELKKISSFSLMQIIRGDRATIPSLFRDEGSEELKHKEEQHLKIYFKTSRMQLKLLFTRMFTNIQFITAEMKKKKLSQDIGLRKRIDILFEKNTDNILYRMERIKKIIYATEHTYQNINRVNYFHNK